MITGILLLIWGIGVVGLAFKLQTEIQESTDPEWVYAKDLYNEAPIIFCVSMAIALAAWPIALAVVLYKAFAKGKQNGN